MKNRELAAMFERLADLSEFKDENIFKVNAYRKASRTIRDLTTDIEEIARSQDLESLPGIGKGSAKKILEFLETGTMESYEKLRKTTPQGLIPLMKVRGLGPKTLAVIFEKTRIRNADDLLKAINKGALISLEGFGEKRIEKLKKGLELFKQSEARMLLGRALMTAREIIGLLMERSPVERIDFAGSLRRYKETIGDIDILAASDHGKEVVESFTRLAPVEQIVASGTTKASVIIEGNTRIDLRVVPEESYGAALQYFTGSKSHNVALRGIARARGFKINEYGIFKGEKRVGGKEEAGIYAALGMDWIPCELREDRGEIEAAQEAKLPCVVARDQIRGDLHVHSNWSDGSHAIADLAGPAKGQGYEYILITDHSKSLRIAHGLDEKRLLQQMDEIDAINSRMRGFRFLKGCEVDILDDGTLDYSDEVLSRLDLVVASIHTGFSQSSEKLTGRIVSALENPFVHILAHPTGRLIGSREPYALDMDRVITAAAACGAALEINANEERLDLNDIHARSAARNGVMISIGTDAHSPEQLWMMELGAGVARRGWLESTMVLNCLGAKELIRWAQRKRSARA